MTGLRSLPARDWIVAAALLTFVLHLLYVGGPLLSDEGGFAMVARWWHLGGPHLYGSQWVDRPPGLISVFWVADHLGPGGVRIMAGLVATGFVLAAAWAAWAARGPRAAVWSAWAGVFLMNTPLTQTFALNGELVAAAWTMLAVASVIHAARRSRRRATALPCAALAGAAAAMALATKQNFVDAIVFVAVFLIAQTLLDHRVRSGRSTLTLGAAALAGFAVPLLVVAGWAAATSSVHDLFYATYGFRVDAAEVLSRWTSRAPGQRFWILAGLAVVTGIVPLTLAVVVAGRRHASLRSPLFLASVAAGLSELAGIVLGGNYWAHYLIGPAPMLALAAGILAVGPGRSPRWVRVAVAVPVVLTLAAAPAGAWEARKVNTIEATGGWLRDAARPHDSLVVLYSHANLIDAAGLRPAYPYAWSLPVRTLDPQLRLLTATLADPGRAPTWVVAWDGLHAWELDSDRVVERALAIDYVEVATVCGHPVWLRRGVRRELGPDPCAGRDVRS